MAVDMFRNFEGKNIGLMDECLAMLHKLEQIDPSRSGYYKDTRKSTASGCYIGKVVKYLFLRIVDSMGYHVYPANINN